MNTEEWSVFRPLHPAMRQCWMAKNSSDMKSRTGRIIARSNGGREMWSAGIG